MRIDTRLKRLISEARILGDHQDDREAVEHALRQYILGRKPAALPVPKTPQSSAMATLSRHLKKSLLLAIAAVICSASAGCDYFPESTFRLAPESRLPKWISLPPGLTRADVSLEMSYYIKITPWSNNVRFVLRGKNNQTTERLSGKLRCNQPFELEPPPVGFSSDHSTFEAVTVNGTTEIVEHKKMEPIFYVTDNPAVWKQYETKGC